MKKIKYIMIVLLILITGCQKKESLVCTSNKSDTGMNITNTTTVNFVSKKLDNVIIDIEVETIGNYSKYTDMLKENFDKKYKKYKKESIEYKSEVQGNKVLLKMTFDGKKMSNQTKAKFDIGSSKKIEDIKSSLEKSGYSCK